MAHRLYRPHLMEEIARCDRHIAQTRTHIARQEQMIAWRETTGRDPTLSCTLLSTFWSVLDAHERHRGILLRELA